MGSQNWSWRVRQEAFNPYVSGKLREIIPHLPPLKQQSSPPCPLEGSAGCPVLLDVPPPSRYNNERKREEEDP